MISETDRERIEALVKEWRTRARCCAAMHLHPQAKILADCANELGGLLSSSVSGETAEPKPRCLYSQQRPGTCNDDGRPRWQWCDPCKALARKETPTS